LAALNKQQRENIVCSAQNCLRLIAFDQIHTILGMEERLSISRKRGIADEGDDENGRDI
jgi:hypothetical protein